MQRGQRRGTLGEADFLESLRPENHGLMPTPVPSPCAQENNYLYSWKRVENEATFNYCVLKTCLTFVVSEQAFPGQELTLHPQKWLSEPNPVLFRFLSNIKQEDPAEWESSRESVWSPPPAGPCLRPGPASGGGGQPAYCTCAPVCPCARAGRPAWH